MPCIRAHPTSTQQFCEIALQPTYLFHTRGALTRTCTHPYTTSTRTAPQSIGPAGWHRSPRSTPDALGTIRRAGSAASRPQSRHTTHCDARTAAGEHQGTSAGWALCQQGGRTVSYHQSRGSTQPPLCAGARTAAESKPRNQGASGL